MKYSGTGTTYDLQSTHHTITAIAQCQNRNLKSGFKNKDQFQNTIHITLTML